MARDKSIKYINYAGGIANWETIDPYVRHLRYLLAQPIGEITSRDQIINPYAILNPNMYSGTKYGVQQYENDLAAFKLLAERQEAAYQEWYNTPKEQVEREREAGLNPDLLGNVDSGASAQVSDPTIESPRSGFSTPLQDLVSFSGVVGSFASLASLPFSIGASVAQMRLASKQADLTGAQAEGQSLANLNNFERLVFENVSGRLADSVASAQKIGQSFDVDSWFANPDNFSGVFESYAPSDDPRYRASYDRAIKNVQKLRGAAYGINAQTETQKSSFAELLSNPYHDDDLLLQVAYMEPMMQAFEQLRLLRRDYDASLFNIKQSYINGLDASAAAAATNAKMNYESEYFSNFSGDEAAAADLLLKSSQAIIENCKSQVTENNLKIYKLNPSSYLGLRASSVVMGQGIQSVEDYLKMLAIDLAADIDGSEDVFDNSSFSARANKGVVSAGDTVSWPTRPFTLSDILDNK